MKAGKIIILVLITAIICFIQSQEEINEQTENEHQHQQQSEEAKKTINNQKENEEIIKVDDNIKDLKNQIEEKEVQAEVISNPSDFQQERNNDKEEEVKQNELNEQKKKDKCDQINLQNEKDTISYTQEESNRITDNVDLQIEKNDNQSKEPKQDEIKTKESNIHNKIPIDNNKENEINTNEFNIHNEIPIEDNKDKSVTSGNENDKKANIQKETKVQIRQIIETFLIKMSQDVLTLIPYPFDLVLYSILGYLFISLLFSSSTHIHIKNRRITPDQNIQLIEKKLKEMSYDINKNKKQSKPENKDENMEVKAIPDLYANLLTELQSKATLANNQFKITIEKHTKESENLSRFFYEILTELLNKNSK